MPIVSKNYDDDQSTGVKKPLLIGCSGGGGHISAIQGVRNFLSQQHNAIQFPKYAPVLHKKKRDSVIRTNIGHGSFFTNGLYILSPIIQLILKFTHLPLLPHSGDLKIEIEMLNEKERQNKTREYIDMLLDIYPAGFESAAIWNVLQRQDRTDDLKKLIELQKGSDEDNYMDVHREIFHTLDSAAVNNKPYTEIISTQAMGLPALCATVKEYNENHTNHPEIIIHQYMTDLPTKGAVHFFNALSTLSPEQQKQMKLYGVGITEDILKHFFPNGYHFKGVYDIPITDNPMVRAGFKDPTWDFSHKFNVNITLSPKNESPVNINRYDQIASIMLGSQASHDTVEYIESLIKNGMNKIFVFGGKTDVISKKIDAILAKHPDYHDKIIRLGNQDDQQIAQIMSRSDLIITRGGGLSVMEQMAMRHNKRQTVLIHHANSPGRLTSGISWEDDNITALMTHFKKQHVHTEKTSPERAMRQIAEARLISAAKRSKKWSVSKWTTAEITRYIKALHNEQLYKFVDLLQTDMQPLFKHIKHCKKNELNEVKKQESKIDLITQSLMNECGACLKYLETIFVAKEPNLHVSKILSDTNTCKELAPAVASYQIVMRLLATLTDDTNTLLPSQKLRQFKEEYDKPETRQALLNHHDNFIMRFIREINYQLSKVMIFNCIGLDHFFTPSQKVRRQIENLQPQDLDPYFEFKQGS